MVSVNTRRGSGLFCCPERSHVSCVMREIGNQLIAVIRITADRQMTQTRGRIAPWQLQVHADDATACRKCHSCWVCLLVNFQNTTVMVRPRTITWAPTLVPITRVPLFFENLIYLCMHKLVHALRGRNSWQISSVQTNVNPLCGGGCHQTFGTFPMMYLWGKYPFPFIYYGRALYYKHVKPT